jgi:hypothetical protein
MRIHVPEISRERDAVKVSSLVELRGRTEHLWYSVPHDYESYLVTERLDAFVVGLLPLGMKNGEDIHVDGVMSEKLFYSITNYYMGILSTLMPKLRPIKIVPEQLDATVPTERRSVATGFSGGVDSFCALADHLWGPVPDGFRVTHLLLHNVGSFLGGGRKLFEEHYDRLLPAAQELGLPFIKVDSNLDGLFCRAGLGSYSGFQLTHVVRGVSAVLTLQKLIGRYLFASGVKYADCRIHETHDMAYADPMALHLLSTESTELISTGGQHSRVEKTARISDIPITYRYLDVCVKERVGNCSGCYKCNRTMLTLDVLGKLDRYGSIFDLRLYRKNKARLMGKMLSGSDPFMKEIAEEAAKHSLQTPFAARVWALFFRIRNMLRVTLKTVMPESAWNALRDVVRRRRGCAH